MKTKIITVSDLNDGVYLPAGSFNIFGIVGFTRISATTLGKPSIAAPGMSDSGAEHHGNPHL